MGEPSAKSQIQFLTNLQRLLEEGGFVATYKYALLIALAEIAVEDGQDDDSPLLITTSRIAEKFIDLYWRQSAPYVVADSQRQPAVLRQNTKGQAEVINRLQRLRGTYEDSLTAAKRDRKRWMAAVRAVVRTLHKQPLWRLQTVGKEKKHFLYDNIGSGEQITLKPGVGYCLRKHHGIVSDLVKGAWLRYVRRHNGAILGEAADLREFLFGSERANLGVVRPVLKEIQHGECFYCRRSLKGSQPHVDHFIPWSRYPVDLGHNFVLSHSTCNGKKSDRLAATRHLERWATQCDEHGAEVGGELEKRGVVCSLSTSVRIANWAYQQTYDVKGLTWLKGNHLVALDEGWDGVFDELLQGP